MGTPAAADTAGTWEPANSVARSRRPLRNYETYAVCLTGFYGLTGFVRFVSAPGEMDAVRPDQENVT
jgi:hypothetical protein